MSEIMLIKSVYFPSINFKPKVTHHIVDAITAV